jgi:hypothetical protein
LIELHRADDAFAFHEAWEHIPGMLRSILATLAGIIAVFLLVLGIEMIGHSIWPPPPGLDPTDPESVRAAMAQAPLGALVVVAVAWVVGAFAGAWLASRIAERRWPAYVIGGLTAVSSAANLVMIPHPFWFWIVALAIVPLAAYLGGTLSYPKRAQSSAATV